MPKQKQSYDKHGNPKTPMIKVVVSAMSITLVIGVCITYLLFASNSVINLKAEDVDKMTLPEINKRSVATIVETIEEAKTQSPSIPNDDPGGTGDDLGRIIFIGDSRTYHFFKDDNTQYATVEGQESNGIKFYACWGGQLDEFNKLLAKAGDDYDTLISWMGANEAGDFDPYIPVYEGILANGKKMIVCTVGPTDDSKLQPGNDRYTDSKMVEYNNKLTSWANSKNVPVIDLYSWCKSNVQIDPADGIHYTPRPTTTILNQVVSKIASQQGNTGGSNNPPSATPTPSPNPGGNTGGYPAACINDWNTYAAPKCGKTWDMLDAGTQAAAYAHWQAHGHEGW